MTSLSTSRFLKKQSSIFFVGFCVSAALNSTVISPATASDTDPHFQEANATKNVRKHLGDIVNDWSKQYAQEKGLALKWYDLQAENTAMSGKDKYKDKKVTQHRANIEYTGPGEPRTVDANFREFTTWVHNGGSVPQTPQANLSEETHSTTSLTLGESTKLGIQVTASLDAPFGGLEVGVNTEFEFHEEKTRSKTRIQKWEIQGPIQTPSETSMQLLLTVTQKETLKPFDLTADIEGDFGIKLTGHIFKRGKGIKIFPITKVFEGANHPGYEVVGNKVRVKIPGEAKSEFGVCGSLRYLEYPYFNCPGGGEEAYLNNHPETKERTAQPKPDLKPKDDGEIVVESELQPEPQFLENMYRYEYDSDGDSDISIQSDDE